MSLQGRFALSICPMAIVTGADYKSKFESCHQNRNSNEHTVTTIKVLKDYLPVLSAVQERKVDLSDGNNEWHAADFSFGKWSDFYFSYFKWP